jgi:predicted acylesterase/phospholipase RssA
MGVVNALDLAGIQPDIIAGSSVGSITAAMAARVFAERDIAARQRAIVQLAATFISIDRLVLTDRFADFVRNLTLRAGQSHVSIRDMDRVFRAYDRRDAHSYESDLRRVLAAIERLVYVDPFEVRDLVKEARAGHSGAAVELLKQYAQTWLSRGGVALEVLGAEPLDLLIRHRVLDGQETSEARLEPIDTFLKGGIYFFATATNVTKGCLEILGVEQFLGRQYRATLLEALLASSAFPGVFRPRRSWEVMPFSHAADQYIDGGVMDNLPLDAVARFLNVASEVGLVARRPVVNGKPVPHLLFAGSLEVNRRSLDPAGVSDAVSFWGHSARHARELGYNRKIDNYRQMQRDLRMIDRAYPQKGADAPLDLEVVVAKPEWLCGTFAFHPMLGFRRRHQVQSIAHGCMCTLRTLSRLANENGETAPWLAAWGVNTKLLPPRPWCRRNLTRDEKRRGDCWWAPVQCPFSRAALEKHEGTLFTSAASKTELSAIHQSCGEPGTHRARQ